MCVCDQIVIAHNNNTVQKYNLTHAVQTTSLPSSMHWLPVKNSFIKNIYIFLMLSDLLTPYVPTGLICSGKGSLSGHPQNAAIHKR